MVKALSIVFFGLIAVLWQINPILSVNSTDTSLVRMPAPPTAPALNITDLSGKLHTVGQYQGRPMLVHFWATWCAPCRRELPALQRAYKVLEPNGVVVLAINMGEQADHVRRFLSDQTLSFPILINPSSSLRDRWQLLGMPTTYVVDGRGKIVYGAVGERDWASKHILDLLISLN